MDLGSVCLSLPDARFVSEMTDKGFAPARVTFNKQSFELMFVDPVRAGQDLQELERLGIPCTDESNVVLVLEVTPERLARSVQYLHAQGYFLRSRSTLDLSGFEYHIHLDL